MKKTKIVFEITKDKTEVTAFSEDRAAETFDISGTDIEKDLIPLLKKIIQYQLTNKLLTATDIKTWREVTP